MLKLGRVVNNGFIRRFGFDENGWMGAKKVLKGILKEGAKLSLWEGLNYPYLTIYVLSLSLSLSLFVFLDSFLIIYLHKERDFGIHLFCP